MNQEIRWISLKNNGGFVARIRVHGAGSYNVNKDIRLGEEKVVDLADAVGSIRDGDEVWLEVVVKAGKNNKAKQRFTYRKSSNLQATYSIKGTTLNNKMSYNGIVENYIKIAQPIRAISLKNSGAFVVRIRIKTWHDSYNQGQDICVGQDKTFDLAETYGGIKEGDEVWLEAVVTAGYNNIPKQHFIYSKTSSMRASFSIKGTTLNNSIAYNGLESYYTIVSQPIRFVTLKNNGGFVARIRVRGEHGSYTLPNDIRLGEEKRIDIANAGVSIKEGDQVWLETVVVGGANNTGRQRFTYKRSADNKACYSISGTTQINSLSYNGTHKIGVYPFSVFTEVELIRKIDTWDSRRTACAWPGIEKSEIVHGLKKIVSLYFKSNQYTNFKDLDVSSGNGYNDTLVCQGKGYPICGPVAVMFYLAKLNMSTFIDTITSLYETGSLMGYNVPSELRQLEKYANKVEDKYYCEDPYAANVCWMFQASLAQKESISDIELDPSAVKMHTRHNEMEDDLKFVFNTSSEKLQQLASWATESKALDNLKEWESYLKDNGTVFWMMHSTPLKNKRDNNNDSYTHLRLTDLHWVVVLSAKRNADGNIELVLHSWNVVYKLTVSKDEFQKMSYLAVLFKVKP